MNTTVLLLGIIIIIIIIICPTSWPVAPIAKIDQRPTGGCRYAGTYNQEYWFDVAYKFKRPLSPILPSLLLKVSSQCKNRTEPPCNKSTQLHGAFIANESVSIQMAPCRFPGLAISNAKILIYFWNKIYGIDFIRNRFYQTALGNLYGLKLPKCWLQFKK